MNLLALNAAHIFRIFDAIGNESKYVCGEIALMKSNISDLR